MQDMHWHIECEPVRNLELCVRHGTFHWMYGMCTPVTFSMAEQKSSVQHHRIQFAHRNARTLLGICYFWRVFEPRKHERTNTTYIHTHKRVYKLRGVAVETLSTMRRMWLVFVYAERWCGVDGKCMHAWHVTWAEWVLPTAQARTCFWETAFDDAAVSRK